MSSENIIGIHPDNLITIEPLSPTEIADIHNQMQATNTTCPNAHCHCLETTNTRHPT